jgi:CheY-like chemotaxis protein
MADTASLAECKILIVEDEPFVALDVAEALEEAGAEVVTAPGLEKVLAFAAMPGLSAAILDFRLGFGIDTAAIGERLTSRGVPFMFYSAYAMIEGKAITNTPLLQKPATREQIVGAVAGLIDKARF